MSAHTPGPWGLETVATQVGVCHKIGPFPSGTEWRPQTHACVYVDGQRQGATSFTPVQETLLANARLMAAAPDLLAACDSLRQVVEQLTIMAKVRPDQRGIIDVVLSQANAAIAKAEGRS